ncbi:MAG: PorP/SprF family type IX secretion system membrane protein [Bacteroidales bacterium]|nr:PorP/SprF family type IX secretion system membrane protein [Bacteroidales bacterium]
MSIFLALFYSVNAQEITFSDPYSEKILFNPAYSGLNECAEINLTYRKTFFNDLYSSSYNQYFKKYNSGIGFIISDFRQGNNAINNLKTDLIYTYKLNIGNKKILNTAIQISYIQQNINTDNLIFNNQIDPVNGVIYETSGETFFKTYKDYDFSIGSTYISDKYRFGLSLHHIDKIFKKNNPGIINTGYTIHIGKVFSVRKRTNQKYFNIFTPEFIYNYQNNSHQIIYGFNIINNIFLTRIFIKHNLLFNSVSSIFTLGLNYKNIRISYTYDMLMTKYISLPTGGNQLSIRYKFKCRKKRNIKNTIFCSNI